MEDTAKARGAIADVAATLTTDLVCVVAAYLIAFIHCWRLTLVLTGSLPLEVLAYYMHSRLGAPKSGAQSSDAVHATQVLVDAFGNVKTIKAYSLEASLALLGARGGGGARRQLQLIVPSWHILPSVLLLVR
jgi:ABC-type bacteriocin/lantibiotic exporter with double-glycine peptidase domain